MSCEGTVAPVHADIKIAFSGRVCISFNRETFVLKSLEQVKHSHVRKISPDQNH